MNNFKNFLAKSREYSVGSRPRKLYELNYHKSHVKSQRELMTHHRKLATQYAGMTQELNIKNAAARDYHNGQYEIASQQEAMHAGEVHRLSKDLFR